MLVLSGEMMSWFDFLLIEADLAMTFIDSARIHLNPGASAISLGNARKAFAQIQRGLMRPASHGLNENEVLVLEKRRAQIEAALATFSI
jgi:hypothetical protein